MPINIGSWMVDMVHYRRPGNRAGQGREAIQQESVHVSRHKWYRESAYQFIHITVFLHVDVCIMYLVFPANCLDGCRKECGEEASCSEFEDS